MPRKNDLERATSYRLSVGAQVTADSPSPAKPGLAPRGGWLTMGLVGLSLFWLLPLDPGASKLTTGWSGTKVAAQETEPTPAPPDEELDATPPAIVPPDGPEDSWGYHVDEEAIAAPENPASDRPKAPKIVRARLISELGHRYVTNVRHLRDGVGRVEWSRQGDWIAYDKLGDRGVRSLYIGSIGAESEHCLTCEHWDFRNASVMSPTWHPGGEYLIATVQKVAKKLDLDTAKLATPARGLHSDLWAITRDGRDAWQMTQVVTQGGAILDPVFSQEGRHLAWTQRVNTTAGGRWGTWQVQVAEFSIKRQLPRFGDVRAYELPWPAVATVHGFTDDDRGLWLSIGGAPGRNRSGPQPAKLDLETGQLETFQTLGLHDELILGVPRSDRRIWTSDRDIERPHGAVLPRRSDLWFMSESGRRQERLTYFNEAASPNHLGEAWIADLSWNPTGDKLLMQVLTSGPSGVEEDLYMLELSPELTRRNENR